MLTASWQVEVKILVQHVMCITACKNIFPKLMTDDSSDWRVAFHSYDVHTPTFMKNFHPVPYYQHD